MGMAAKVPAGAGVTGLFAATRADEFYRTLPIGFALLDRNLRIVHANPLFAGLTETTAERCLGRTLGEVLPKFAIQIAGAARLAKRSRVPVNELLTDDPTAPRASPEERFDRTMTLAAARGADGRVVGINCFIQEALRQPSLRQSLQERLAFESFLSDLSAKFINVPTEQIDAEIQHGLKALVEFLDVERATVASATAQDGSATVLGAYAVPGVPAVTPNQPFPGLAAMRWYVGELMAGRTVRLRSPNDLPAHAKAERAYCLSTGLKSHLGIPITVAGLPLCVLGIASFREERSFSDELVSRLRMIGELLGNALARRDADRELRHMHNELSHVTRVSTVGQLAASLAHEVNQPLCAIQSNAHAALRLLAARKPDTDEIRAALQDIIADSNRASAVIAKAHAMLKRREAEFAHCSVNEAVADVQQLLHSDAVIRRVELGTELADNLPPIHADLVQLQQVIMNLVLNAMDAIAQASAGPRQIILQTQAVEGGVQVSVSDSGIGLSAEVLAKMFEPFFTTKQNGLGMGLAINREIIRAHGGRIWASSRSPCGATVAFFLPAAENARLR